MASLISGDSRAGLQLREKLEFDRHMVWRQAGCLREFETHGPQLLDKSCRGSTMGPAFVVDRLRRRRDRTVRTEEEAVIFPIHAQTSRSAGGFVNQSCDLGIVRGPLAQRVKDITECCRSGWWPEGHCEEGEGFLPMDPVGIPRGGVCHQVPSCHGPGPAPGDGPPGSAPRSFAYISPTGKSLVARARRSTPRP